MRTTVVLARKRDIFPPMSGCPFHATDPVSRLDPPPLDLEGAGEGEGEFTFLEELYTGAELRDRTQACLHAFASGAPAPLFSEELVWAGRVAWRNSSRCIGRLHWRSLAVRDRREVSDPDEMAEALREHLALAQNDGAIRSFMTVFAPIDRRTGEAPRVWNHQLCAYAGYRQPDGSILGDPKNADFTALALALGWEAPRIRGRFDLLPWIISGHDGRPRVFPLPAGAVREIEIRHPELPWFSELGLRWYAVPVISDMRLRAAGTDYLAAPFNGWYMSTEIAARDLSDAQRYDMLPAIADRLGLDRSRPSTLWKDRALLELNVAVIHSYQADGIRMVDHHTASEEFMKFCRREEASGRDVSARWDWIVPPMSSATTPVFHTTMREFPASPNFHVQPPVWRSHLGGKAPASF